MATHRIMMREGGVDRLAPGDAVALAGDEAKHVRVKRLTPGEAVEILDGMGHVAHARIVDGGREVRVERVERVEALSPRVEVMAATPKGGRLDEMIGGLSQVGAASWRGLATSRGEGEATEKKLVRLEHLAAEASKQCGRAWVMEIGERVRLTDVGGSECVVADASGTAYEATGAPVIRLLVGPEGGWTAEELAALREGGARVCSFGAHVMRIEVAAVVATGIVIDAERRGSLPRMDTD